MTESLMARISGISGQDASKMENIDLVDTLLRDVLWSGRDFPERISAFEVQHTLNARELELRAEVLRRLDETK